MGILPNSAGMIPGWSPTKIIQMVLIGCKSRSHGSILGLQKSCLKLQGPELSYLISNII